MPETQKPAVPADEQGGDAGNAQADGGKIQAQKAVTAEGRTRCTRLLLFKNIQQTAGCFFAYLRENAICITQKPAARIH